MVTLTATNPTLLDLAKIMAPDGSIQDVIEILNETNEVMLDMTWLEGNMVDGHQTTIRTGIPQPTWRKFNAGVQPNKSTTTQVKYNTGMMEQYSEVDWRLAKLNGNSAAWRLQEDKPHIEGMNQELVDTFFYGNEKTEPEAFTGIVQYYNSLSAPSGDNIIDGGGTGADNNSIWLIIWSPTTAHGIIPKGSTAGLIQEDLGRVTLEDASNGSNTGRMEALRTHYMWDAGFALKDWRYCVRIANIDKSLLSKDIATGADLPDLMFQAMDRVPNLSVGRPAFYMPRDLRTKLRQQLSYSRSMSTLETDKVGGTLVTMFQGLVPIRRVDALSGDEARVT